VTAPADGQAREGAVSAVVGSANVPEPIRSVDTLAHPSYADAFTIRTSGAGATSAEAWARTILERTPTGRSAPRLWRLLGLRLGPRPSPEHVQGWWIAERGDRWIRLATSSRCMTAHAIVRVDEHEVTLALSIRADHPVAAMLWPPVAILHRRAVPGMLRQAIGSRDDGRGL
jgi:hypothetical protein